MKMHKIYVYGTLMTGKGEPVTVPGKLYDLGWFPGAKIGTPEWGTEFKAEIIEVSSGKLKELDEYEGYYENAPGASLYIRRPYFDGFIYEYNHTPPEDRLISSGDWKAYKLEREKEPCIREFMGKEFAVEQERN